MEAEAADSKKMWDAEFAKWNRGNLGVEGVYSEEEWKFVLVREDHPVIKLLRNNEDLLGCKIGPPPVGGCMYKVSEMVFKSCCTTLLDKVMTWGEVVDGANTVIT